MPFFSSSGLQLLAVLVAVHADDREGALLYFSTSDRSCGYIARHGPHQLPQKSSSTTLPR
jgi:hypothetical protein